MDSNNRYPEDRYYPERNNPRHLGENQRIGQEINRSRGNQYRSGQSYHNQNEGYSSDQTHYGSRPDSAYRDDSRINYGDNRQRGQNQRFDQHQHRDNDYRYNQNNQSRRNYNNQNNDFDNPGRGDHAGTRFWGEREEFKHDDYRYTSGNRGNWHTPGTNDDDEANYNNRYQNHRFRQPEQEEGFFDRMSRRIDNTWDRLTGNNHEENDQDYNRNQHPQNRNFNRGYESGPRWADEDDRQNRPDRYDRRNQRDDY